MLIEVRRCCLRAVSTWRARALILGNGRSRPEGPGLYTFRTFGRKRARYRRDHSRGDLHPELENSPARRIPYPRRDGDATIEDTDSLAHDRSRKLNSSRRAEERRWGGGGEEGEREGGGIRGERRAGKTRVKAHLTRQRKLIGHLPPRRGSGFLFSSRSLNCAILGGNRARGDTTARRVTCDAAAAAAAAAVVVSGGAEGGWTRRGRITIERGSVRGKQVFRLNAL